MILGLEYVVAAYGIWLLTFAGYIFLTKHHLKITNRAVRELEQRGSGTFSVSRENYT